MARYARRPRRTAVRRTRKSGPRRVRQTAPRKTVRGINYSKNPLALLQLRRLPHHRSTGGSTFNPSRSRSEMVRMPNPSDDKPYKPLTAKQFGRSALGVLGRNARAVGHFTNRFLPMGIGGMIGDAVNAGLQYAGKQVSDDYYKSDNKFVNAALSFADGMKRKGSINKYTDKVGSLLLDNSNDLASSLIKLQNTATYLKPKAEQLLDLKGWQEDWEFPYGRPKNDGNYFNWGPPGSNSVGDPNESKAEVRDLFPEYNAKDYIEENTFTDPQVRFGGSEDSDLSTYLNQYVNDNYNSSSNQTSTNGRYINYQPTPRKRKSSFRLAHNIDENSPTKIMFREAMERLRNIK